MKKRIAVALLLILGLTPYALEAHSVPVESIQTPNIPQNITLQSPVDNGGEETLPVSESCLDQNPIWIDGSNIFALQTLTEKINDYQTYGVLNTAKNRYELCFDIQVQDIEVPNTLTIVPNVAADQTKGLAIYGLKVRPHNNLPAGDPVIEVNFPIAPVELIDLSMDGITNGLIANGTQLKITNATIVGNGSGVGGDRCIELSNADNSVIVDSTISDCYVAIHVLNSNNTRIGGVSDMTGKNTITNNAKGILVVGSSSYKHGYNLIYGNDRIDDDFLYAVEIEGYPAPDPELFEATTEIVGNNVYSLDCKTDPDNPRITFSRTGGSAQLYIVGLQAKQAYKYFMTCDLSSTNQCIFSSLPAGYGYNAEDCAIVDQNTDIVEITGFHTSDHSSELMPSIKLDGLPPVIFAESEGVDVPTAPAEDGGDDVSLVSGATGSSEGGGGEITALGAKGGCMGGSSLLPNDVGSTYAPHLGMWWIIFSVVFLASLRFAKVRKRRRRK